jgi:O-antigen/teichoic acid export membrane protein
MDDSKSTGLPKGVVSNAAAPITYSGSSRSPWGRLKMFSTASMAPILEFAFRLIRTAILAHILAPDDVGAAVALAAILVSCEAITDVGLEHFVVISLAGDPAQVTAVARQVSIARSFMLGAMIVVFAPYLALFFNAPGEVANIRWLAACPFIKSVKNWRIIQIQAEYRFGPNAIARILSAMGSAVSMIPAALWFHDARAMVVGLGIEVLLYTILSHLLVSRQRVVVVDPALRRAALSFGLPLMVNGIGLLILSQFDRVLVANLFGLEVLAAYSLSLNLIMAPVAIVSNVIGTIGLPYIRRAGTERQAIRGASLAISAGSTLTAAACAVVIGSSLDWLVPLVYGSNFKITAPFQAILTVITFVRIIRAAPNLLLLVQGRTKHVALGNVAAGFGLLVAVFLASWYHRVEIVALGLLLGDLLSLGVLLLLVGNYLPIKALLGHVGVLLIFSVGTAALGPWIILGSITIGRAIALGIAISVITLDGFILYRSHFNGLERTGWRLLF